MNAPFKVAGHARNPDAGRSLACALCTVRDKSVCVEMSERDLYQVENVMARRFVPKGQLVMAEGEPNKHMHMLVNGSIRLSKHLEDGRRQVTGFLFAGDILGVRAAEQSAYSADTLEDSQICRFPHSFLEHASRDAPAVKDRLIARGQDEYHQAQDHIVLLGKNSSIERVAGFISTLNKKVGTNLPDGNREIRLPMSRRDIADYLGLRIETLSRSLGRLKESGFLTKVTRDHLVLSQE